MQGELREPKGPKARVGKRDDLCVERGIIRADSLNAHLLQLPIPAMLRPLCTEEWSGVPEFRRKLASIESVLDDEPHDPRRALGTQREGTSAPVLKGVHLLGDDIGRLADPSDEQAGVLEHRQFGVAVSGKGGRPAERRAHGKEGRSLLAEVLGHPLWCLEHGHHMPRDGAADAPSLNRRPSLN